MVKLTELQKQNRKPVLLFLFFASVMVLAIGFLSSLKWGQAHTTWPALWEALTWQGKDKAHLYIQTLRLPRTLTALLVGVQLALAGLLTQLITRNPLASPHLLGIHAGASLAVVVALITFSAISLTHTVLFGFAGAALGVFLVWLLAGSQQKQHVQLTLAGIAVSLLLSSLTEGLTILNQHSTESMLFWLVGSVDHASWAEVRTITPFALIGFAVFMLMIPSIKLLAMDDAVAIGLGGRVAVIKAICMLLVIVLAGSAVAICGPIGFVGLIVPHIARALVGGRLVLLVPLTALLGGSLLLYADFISRFIAFPYESPVGIVTAAIGGPFFIYLARKKGGAR
ncbi:FecCD family ABC transporter permease [Paenibacillus sp. Soil522]|uniref:FecCD family ABC transporter permease n=1 Tax=Paenibacillus sp. Soil522 TaxID=1736388 RepID=UPI000701ED18|nr:iron ABC transporter permease [Paenibacillus sp. Soil522]KRE47829.1 ABC transporter permease [Paenibacillus sp. Soil522]